MRPEEHGELTFPEGFAKGVIERAKREKRRRRLALGAFVLLAAAATGAAWLGVAPKPQVVIATRAPAPTCPWGCPSTLTGDGEEPIASAAETDRDPFH